MYWELLDKSYGQTDGQKKRKNLEKLITLLQLETYMKNARKWIKGSLSHSCLGKWMKGFIKWGRSYLINGIKKKKNRKWIEKRLLWSDFNERLKKGCIDLMEPEDGSQYPALKWLLLDYSFRCVSVKMLYTRTNETHMHS